MHEATHTPRDVEIESPSLFNLNRALHFSRRQNATKTPCTKTPSHQNAISPRRPKLNALNYLQRLNNFPELWKILFDMKQKLHTNLREGEGEQLEVKYELRWQMVQIQGGVY